MRSGTHILDLKRGKHVRRSGGAWSAAMLDKITTSQVATINEETVLDVLQSKETWSPGYKTT